LEAGRIAVQTFSFEPSLILGYKGPFQRARFRIERVKNSIEAAEIDQTIEITENGRVAGLKMTRSSEGVNRGGIHVVFRFTPEAVTERAKRDWTSLLALID